MLLFAPLGMGGAIFAPLLEKAKVDAVLRRSCVRFFPEADQESAPFHFSELVLHAAGRLPRFLRERCDAREDAPAVVVSEVGQRQRQQHLAAPGWIIVEHPRHDPDGHLIFVCAGFAGDDFCNKLRAEVNATPYF